MQDFPVPFTDEIFFQKMNCIKFAKNFLGSSQYGKRTGKVIFQSRQNCHKETFAEQGTTLSKIYFVLMLTDISNNEFIQMVQSTKTLYLYHQGGVYNLQFQTQNEKLPSTRRGSSIRSTGESLILPLQSIHFIFISSA